MTLTSATLGPHPGEGPAEASMCFGMIIGSYSPRQRSRPPPASGLFPSEPSRASMASMGKAAICQAQPALEVFQRLSYILPRRSTRHKFNSGCNACLAVFGIGHHCGCLYWRPRAEHCRVKGLHSPKAGTIGLPSAPDLWEGRGLPLMSRCALNLRGELRFHLHPHLPLILTHSCGWQR